MLALPDRWPAAAAHPRRHPELSLAEARNRARAALEQADRGVDPAAAATRRGRGETVADVAGDFIARHVQRNQLRSAGRIEQMLKTAILPTWGARPIRSITKRDALDLVDDVAARAPYMANRVQALAKQLFSWAMERSIVDASPLAGLRRPAKERSRERVLDDRELAGVWRAAGELGWPFGEITKLLILTGARRTEVAGLRWSEIDLERRLWTKPAERTKAARVHELPLSDPALEIIASCRGSTPRRGYSCPVGLHHATGLQHAKQRLDRLSGVAGWRYHDLREDRGQRHGQAWPAAHVVAAVLDHSPAGFIGVNPIYARHKYEREVRDALAAWAAHVEHLAVGGAKVLKLG